MSTLGIDRASIANEIALRCRGLMTLPVPEPKTSRGSMRLPSPETVRRVAPLACGIGAFFALAMFGVAAWGDHTATASAAAALCLALGVLAALDLETFEGLGIKAKLRSTLTDAEKRLDNLDRMTRVLANGAFLNISRGFVSTEEQRASVAEMTASLEASSLDRTEIDLLKRPVYGFIASGLWSFFANGCRTYTVEHANQLRLAEINTPDGPERERVRGQIRHLYGGPKHTLTKPDAYEGFPTFIEKVAQGFHVLDEDDRPRFIAVAQMLINLFEECVREGNLTPRVVVILEELGESEGPFQSEVLRMLGLRPDEPPSQARG